MNSNARKSFGEGFAVIGLGLVILVTLAVFASTMISEKTFSYGPITVLAISVVLLFWAGGRMIALAFTKEEELAKPEAPANGLPSTPNQ